jgi:hypothetical protein
MTIAALITQGIGPGGSVPYLLTGGLDLGEAVVQPVTQARGGWLPTKREIEEEERFRKKRREREKELREEIEHAYAALYENAATAPQALEVVAPYVEGRPPTKKLPAPARIDFSALAGDIEAAEALLRLYQEERDDEEAATMLLSVV